MNETDGNQSESLIEQAFPAIESKKDELILLGYEDVTTKLIIDCLMQSVWKKGMPHKIHNIVQDIFSLKPSVYMSFMTTTAYSLDDDLLSSINAVTGNSED